MWSCKKAPSMGSQQESVEDLDGLDISYIKKKKNLIN